MLIPAPGVYLRSAGTANFLLVVFCTACYSFLSRSSDTGSDGGQSLGQGFDMSVNLIYFDMTVAVIDIGFVALTVVLRDKTSGFAMLLQRCFITVPQDTFVQQNSTVRSNIDPE